MQKKFSVFISSPYKGMQDVRATVSTAVPEEFLKRADGAGFPGVGYTELECRYAEKRGIPVLPFLHTSPEKMLVGEAASGETDEKWRKLQAFRARLERGNPGYWESPLDLRATVKDALHRAMLAPPNRPGWVRGSHLEHAEGEVKRWKEKAERLEKENEGLRKKFLPSSFGDGGTPPSSSWGASLLGDGGDPGRFGGAPR